MRRGSALRRRAHDSGARPWVVGKAYDAHVHEPRVALIVRKRHDVLDAEDLLLGGADAAQHAARPGTTSVGALASKRNDRYDGGSRTPRRSSAAATSSCVAGGRSTEPRFSASGNNRAYAGSSARSASAHSATRGRIRCTSQTGACDIDHIQARPTRAFASSSSQARDTSQIARRSSTSSCWTRASRAGLDE